MNTPRKRKRYSPDPPENFMAGIVAIAQQGGQIQPGLANPNLALKLALIVTRFEHLEDQMARFLAVLSGADWTISGYILRAVKSPRGRKEVMSSLLEFAERNKDLGEEYDQVIAEFAQTAGMRNTYVHGRWWTSLKGNLVTFAPTDPYCMEIMQSQPINEKELDYVLYRIKRTSVLVTRLTLVPPEERAQLPAIPPLAPPPTQRSRARQQRAPKAPPPQRKPSKASPRKAAKKKPPAKPKTKK